MRKTSFVFILLVGICLAVTAMGQVGAAQAGAPRQQPTGVIPTVTSSPLVALIIVNADQDQINVRSGPGTDYDTVGILTARQRVAALGRSPGGDWVQIVYPGVASGVAWVYSYLVTLQGTLPIVEPPPTPTPRVTPTIDPTLAAQFILELAPTRLPTYTAPPPLNVPTYVSPLSQGSASGLPMGFIIVGLVVVGVFGLLISLLRGR